ncbi:MAG: hypothetical protein V7K92_27285, partial [Nostoc sp.]|uniref:hypothetical protein n=1 Tax=Nostoc sp. TaxID=1180 RepID=UPI002FF3E837
GVLNSIVTSLSPILGCSNSSMIHTAIMQRPFSLLEFVYSEHLRPITVCPTRLVRVPLLV